MRRSYRPTASVPVSTSTKLAWLRTTPRPSAARRSSRRPTLDLEGRAHLLRPGKVVLHRDDAGGARRPGDVERLPDVVDALADRRVGDRVADAKRGQAERFGQRAQHDHIAMPGKEQRQAVAVVRVVDELLVRLVEDHRRRWSGPTAPDARSPRR